MSFKNLFINKFILSIFISSLVIFGLIGFSIKSNTTVKEVSYNKFSSIPLSSLVNKREPASLSQSKGLSVVIPLGEVAYLDESTNIDILTINGELHCDETQADSIVELKVKTIYINGIFQCGTKRNPYNKKLIISLKDSSIDPKQDPAYRGIMIMTGGRLILNGDRSKAGWVKLNETAMPGDDSIVVRNKYIKVLPSKYTSRKNRGRSRSRVPNYARGNGFKVGDKIAIGPTGYNFEEAESFTITDINPSEPDRLYLDHPVEYLHWGKKQFFKSKVLGQIILDESAEVANLTRSILIRADETDGPIDESDNPTAQRGGHIMAHHGGEAYIDSIELYKMGQAGVMGRYPFHWHYAGDAPGQYVKNSSIHHSYQRCITIHRTNKVLIENNVCFNFKGHGYFLEGGTEVENKIIRNLAIKATAPSASKVLLASDDIAHSEGQGRFPSVSGFWISHPNNYITHNVVSGSVGTGFWMSFEREIKDQTGSVVARPLTSATDTFNYNTAHSMKTGITWDGAPGWQSANNPNNPNDKKITSAHYAPPVVPVFKGLRAYKNSLSGIYFRGQTAVYERTVVADNGWSFWVAYNQIVRDSVFIGKTNNHSDELDDFFYNTTRSGRYRKNGMVLYDGPFEIHNSDFINFSTSPSTYVKSNGQIINNTYVPFTSTGGSNKFTNLVSKLRFSPEPVHRIHMEDAKDNTSTRQYLGNAVIRDRDGSFSKHGFNSVVVAKRSLGIYAKSQCVDGGVSFHNFKICPSNYTEGSLAFMRWGSSQASPWRTPFVVRRNDGALSYPISEWNTVAFRENNLFATANTKRLSYKLLPKFQYEKDRLIGANAKIDANTESVNPIIPMVQIVAYGNNCKLGLGAIEATSKADLLSKTETAYYTSGEEFFVRVVPIDRWNKISDDPVVQATALRSPGRYPITCDAGYLTKKIKGEIESVSRATDTTTISGWACNYTQSSSIQVKVYAIERRRHIATTRLNKGLTKPKPPVAVPVTDPSLITSGYSNQTPDAKISMNCGYMSGSGRRFSITMQNSDLDIYPDHKFHVKGISNSGGASIFIQNSGKYSVVQRRIKPVLIRK